MLTAIATACVHIFRHVDVEEIVASDMATVVASPVKAHLTDGTTIVFAKGVIVTRGRIEGTGYRFAITDGLGAPGIRVSGVALDSVLGMEVFRTKVNAGSSVLVSAGSTVVTLAGLAALAIAIFGSCPTFYSDSAGAPALEAEGFSYSIAPLFERRDVDRLRVQARAGIVELELRNEALETHFLNHVELLEVRHAADEWIVRDEGGRPLAVRALRPALAAVDRAGRDVATPLASNDGVLFATAPPTIKRARAGDLDDYIELTVQAPTNADSIALVLRLRNSLLNTVLLYDGMLREPGARALDWEGRDLDRIGNVLALGRWYGKHMGLRISVLDRGQWREVAGATDTGPIAFHDMAIMVPAIRDETGRHVRLRLAFTADNWRIDRIAVTNEFRRPSPRVIPLASVRRDDGSLDTSSLAALRTPDEAYLETRPGQRATLQFNAGSAPTDSARAFLLATQGYYTEWVRGEWLKHATAGVPFTPSDSALIVAMHRWHERQSTMEREFYASRIPVR